MKTILCTQSCKLANTNVWAADFLTANFIKHLASGAKPLPPYTNTGYSTYCECVDDKTADAAFKVIEEKLPFARSFFTLVTIC